MSSNVILAHYLVNDICKYGYCSTNDPTNQTMKQIVNEQICWASGRYWEWKT